MEPPEHARAAAPGAAGDPLVGRLLDGRYRIGTRVARGGMASVYEATDTRLDRTVAVKVMHPGLGDNAAAGVLLLKVLSRHTHRRTHKIGAYYQGLGALQEHGLYGETKAYVANVLAIKKRLEAGRPPA